MRKILNKITVKKVDFMQIRQFIGQMGKLPGKVGSNRGLTAPPKSLVAIGELQYEFQY